MKIVKIVVGKGLSRDNGDGTWTKGNYELTAELEGLSGDELPKAKDTLEAILDGWLKGTPIPSTTPKPEVPAPTPASTTKWKPTKTPGIEWCPERDADPEDVKRALAKEGGMWTTDSEQYGLAIFRKKKKEGTA